VSRAYPFRRPPDHVVTASPWSRTAPNGIEPLPAVLTGWDYDTVLTLRRRIVVDGLLARTLSSLEKDDPIDLTIRWSASSSLLRGRAWRDRVPAEDGVEFDVEFELAGDQLGGNLELATVLTLGGPTRSTSASAPRRPGSVLWSDRVAVLLQGDTSQFPLAIADFHDLPYPTEAAWYLEIGEDLEAAALGSILLIANERCGAVVSALAAAAAPNEAQRIVLSTLRTELVRTLVEQALTHEDFTNEQDYPPGSLGALLATVLTRYLPAFSLEALRRERSLEPMRFTSRLQGATNLMVTS
jgi:hypothetical protein